MHELTKLKYKCTLLKDLMVKIEDHIEKNLNINTNFSDYGKSLIMQAIEGAFRERLVEINEEIEVLLTKEISRLEEGNKIIN
jgi:hypothetical protein